MVSVDNPGDQAVSLVVSVQVGDRLVEVGRVALFPVDRPGVFRIAVPDDVRHLIRNARSVMLEVTALPATTDASLDTRVAVTVERPEFVAGSR